MTAALGRGTLGDWVTHTGRAQDLLWAWTGVLPVKRCVLIRQFWSSDYFVPFGLGILDDFILIAWSSSMSPLEKGNATIATVALFHALCL